MPSFAEYIVLKHTLSPHYCPNLFGIMGDLAEKDAKKIGPYITGEMLKTDLYVRAALKKAAKTPVIIKLMKILMKEDNEDIVKAKIKELVLIRSTLLESHSSREKTDNGNNEKKWQDYIFPKFNYASIDEAEFIQIGVFIGEALDRLDSTWGNKKEDPFEPFKYSALPPKLQSFFDRKEYEQHLSAVREEYNQLIEKWRHASRIAITPHHTTLFGQKESAEDAKQVSVRSNPKPSENRLEKLIFKSISRVLYPNTKTQAREWQIELYTNLHDIIEKFLQKFPNYQNKQNEIFNGIYMAGLFFIKNSELVAFLNILELSLKHDTDNIQEQVRKAVTQMLDLQKPKNLQPSSATITSASQSSEIEATAIVPAIVHEESDKGLQAAGFCAISPRKRQSRRFSLGANTRKPVDQILQELKDPSEQRSDSQYSACPKPQ